MADESTYSQKKRTCNSQSHWDVVFSWGLDLLVAGLLWGSPFVDRWSLTFPKGKDQSIFWICFFGWARLSDKHAQHDDFPYPVVNIPNISSILNQVSRNFPSKHILLLQCNVSAILVGMISLQTFCIRTAMTDWQTLTTKLTSVWAFYIEPDLYMW